VNLPEETQLGSCSRGDDRHSNSQGTSNARHFVTLAGLKPRKIVPQSAKTVE
jgi:hypothetical protein